ncbi:MAG: hypothetical protein ACREIF_03115 [Chthoniobacterales bacterium]
MKSKLLLVGAGPCAAIAYAFYKTSRFALELARRQVQHGRFEVRRYPGVAVARTGRDFAFRLIRR